MVTRQRRLAQRPPRQLPGPRREVPLATLHDLLWDWTRELDPGQTAQFASPDGSVLHADRTPGGIRLTVVGGHRKLIYRWDARAAPPRLVAPGGLPPSVEGPCAWEGEGAPVLGLRAGAVLFCFPIPTV